MYYVLLTGAKKNIGDFLITDRSKKLLRKERPDRMIHELSAWKRFDDDQLKLINQSQGIIIAGGPGYQRKMYPRVYPLVSDLKRIMVPIIPMALGWKGRIGDELDIETFRFSKSSQQLLTKIHHTCAYSSCRDLTSQRILEHHGYRNVLMTGCSSWYDSVHLQQEFVPPDDIKTIAVSVPQEPDFQQQFFLLLDQITKIFPKSRLKCFFHRGLSTDDFTSPRDAQNVQTIIKHLDHRKISHHDLSYQLESLDLYDDCTMHIGYRLHAHLFFLSQRKPSFLINEDGRGESMQTTLRLNSFSGVRRSVISRWILGHSSSPLSSWTEALLIKTRLDRTIQTDLIKNFLNDIRIEHKQGFPQIQDAQLFIRQQYTIMQKFLRTLP